MTVGIKDTTRGRHQQRVERAPNQNEFLIWKNWNVNFNGISMNWLIIQLRVILKFNIAVLFSEEIGTQIAAIR